MLKRLIARVGEWVREANPVVPVPEPFRIEKPDPSVFAVRGFDFYVRLEAGHREAMLEAWRSQLGGDLTPSADEVQELRELWRERRLIVDCDEPRISGRDVAAAVAFAYSLPGWD